MADSTPTASSLLGQVGGILASSASPLTSGFNAVDSVAKDLGAWTNPTTVQRINQLKEAAQANVTKFKGYLLSGNLAGVQSSLDGLPVYVGVELSPSEYQQLKGVTASLDGNQLLGFFDAGIGAKLQADIAQLVALGAKG